MPEELSPAEVALWILATNAGGHLAFDSGSIKEARKRARSLDFHADPVSGTYFVEAISSDP